MRRIVVAVFVLLAACGSNGGKDPVAVPDVTGATETTNTTAPFTTTEISTPDNTKQAQLVDVQVGEHVGFVRVVFRFSDAVPGYSVRTAEPPFVQDGSGKEVTVDGNGHLAVRLIARAHDDNGKTTVPTAIAFPHTSSIRAVALLGDFEGVVNYAIGLSEPTGFKAFTLTSPPRLVVDIQSP
ncbi:MAG: hypothetical protein QOG90_1256 [Actinomycetota bacterium]|jgi:hypothetical protein